MTDYRNASAGIPIDITTDPDGSILALNNLHQTELSWLDAEQLADLLRQAFYARRIGTLNAFMLAFDEHAAGYDSPNYLWFRTRYRRFVYVDRLVVDAQARGRGHARRLYADLIERATVAGQDRVVCEVNSHPPNPASDALHASLGFTEIGAASIHAGRKQVRYLARPLPHEGARATMSQAVTSTGP